MRRNDAPIDGFGWFLIVALSALLTVPFAVIAQMFGSAAPFVWGALCVGFPIWAIWYSAQE
jgi:hypothetical protein